MFAAGNAGASEEEVEDGPVGPALTGEEEQAADWQRIL